MTIKREEKEGRVSHIDEKGSALVHLEGREKPIELYGGLPGETLIVETTRERRKIRSYLKEIKDPHPERQVPPCQHFSHCGGCQLQQASAKLSQEIKEERLRGYFKEQLDPEAEHRARYLPFLSPLERFHYRNRMEFSFGTFWGKPGIGLYIPKKRGALLHLESCLLVPPWMVELKTRVYQWWMDSGLQAYDPRANRGHLMNLILREGRHTGQKMVALRVLGHSEYALSREQLDTFKSVVTSCLGTESLSLFLLVVQKLKGSPTQEFEMQLHGPEYFQEKLEVLGHTYEYFISPSSFFQPNTLMAQQLFERLLAQADFQGHEVVWDLYCGIGTISLIVSRYVKKVYGIELLHQAVLDARENAKHNGIDNAIFYSGDVPLILEKEEIERPDVVIVDPPRAGLTEKAKSLIIDALVPKIVYVSCNPKTLASDLLAFEKAGYVLESIQGIDQFAQTTHVEAIALIKRKQ